MLGQQKSYFNQNPFSQSMQKQLSQSFFLNLYQNKSTLYEEPVLQILGYEVSQSDSKQIIIRLSDSLSYLDCLLVGPYQIQADFIKTAQSSRVSQTFKKYDFVKVMNYFFKIDIKKISKLVIVIRKLAQQRTFHQKIGLPQEISQFVQNEGRIFSNQIIPAHSSQQRGDVMVRTLSGNLIKIQDQIEENRNGHLLNGSANTINGSQTMMNPFTQKPVSYHSTANFGGSVNAPQLPAHYSVSNTSQYLSKIQNQNYINQQGLNSSQYMRSSQSNYSQNGQNLAHQQQNQNPNQPSASPSFTSNGFSKQREQKSNGSSKPVLERNPHDPLTLKEILMNQKGYFIGRLVRAKFTVKQTAKEKPLSFFYLGFLDFGGDLVRITLAGSYAIKEKSELKIGKCYYISELQSFQNDKMSLPSIKFKDKETKIHQVTAANIVCRLDTDYFHWEHEFDYIEAEFVDVIGIVDRFQEKVSYKQMGTNENREVIRVVIRNHIKTIRISFWAQQIKNLQALGLKKGEVIIMLDVKKKKKFYLDYTFESDLIKLSERPDLKERFKDLLPTSDLTIQPRNLRQLHQLYEKEPSDNKIRPVVATISKITENRIIYRLCNNCKTKMERSSNDCPNCGNTTYHHKFNCYLQIADATASMNCVAFDNISNVLGEKNADQLALLSDDEMKLIIDDCSFGLYLIKVENKNHRYLIRHIEPIQSEGLKIQTKKVLKWINELISPVQ